MKILNFWSNKHTCVFFTRSTLNLIKFYNHFTFLLDLTCKSFNFCFTTFHKLNLIFFISIYRLPNNTFLAYNIFLSKNQQQNKTFRRFVFIHIISFTFIHSHFLQTFIQPLITYQSFQLLSNQIFTTKFHLLNILFVVFLPFYSSTLQNFSSSILLQ